MADKLVIVYDLRCGKKPEKIVNLNSVADIKGFKECLSTECGVGKTEKYVICTINRDEINDNKSFSQLENGETLYILKNLNQELCSQTQQRVEYLPHYDTLVKSGMYEYYASEGQNPLPYAFAELIDNSLSATSQNRGSRHIELRLMLDDTNAEKSMIFVIDNGVGMNSWQLNNWAIYRLSKFIRTNRSFKPVDSSSPMKEMPRYLNSEISYFGVGGKQAIFFIGHATRMISKSKDSQDVHELTVSKEEFEIKEKNQEFVYSGVIRNRKPGDSSHLSADDDLLKKVIAEEVGKESFTCVVIWGISADHIHYLTQFYSDWCMKLTHIYHYYLHGPQGNDTCTTDRALSPFRNIDIDVNLHLKSCSPQSTNLRDIDNDMQSQIIATAASTFDFRAIVDGSRVVEGVIRYHPFLYDHETFPFDTVDQTEPESEHDYFHSDTRPARGRRPIFECFWNGRLIPYTTIQEFDWCAAPKKAKNIPLECYNRISGVLWTNDAFQVSTNKLTFMDLENKLREKNVSFIRSVSGQEKRGHIEKLFTEWLQWCHEHCDKQVYFSGFKGHVSRPELQKQKQYPWAVYESIEWDGKTFKKGQLVRTQRTVPLVIGTIQRFLLYGDHEKDIFATGGDFEVQQEPKTIYDEVKTFSMSKLDRKITSFSIERAVEEEEERLPERLVVSWPEGDEVFPNEKRSAGKTVGAIKVEIANKKGEKISKLPGAGQKKLLVELKVIWHSPKGDVVISQFLCQHAKAWPYWFRKMENIRELGPYTINLQVFSDGETKLSSGKELPSHKIRFNTIEADPEKFTVGLLDGPFRVGSPFSIPLEFQDRFGNSAKPASNLKPSLTANGLQISFEGTQVKGNTLIIKGITAHGEVESSSGKNFSLSVKIPGLKETSQTLKIRLLPGAPCKLIVKPEKDNYQIDNNSSPTFEITAIDMWGNATSDSKLIVTCKFISTTNPNLPVYSIDLSAVSRGNLSGPPLKLKHMSGNHLIIARFEVVNRKDIPVVERNLTVLPSRTASLLEVSYLGEDGQRLNVEKDKDIVWTAGESITGLEYKVFDEGGREMQITQSMAGKVKVNWTSAVAKDKFMNGKLPSIEAPSSLKHTLYCQVSLSDESVLDFGFNVKSKAGEPMSIKAICSGSNKIRIGETLQSDILVSVTDRHGNAIKKLPFKSLAELLLIADDLDFTHVEKGLGQASGFIVKGIKFSEGKLGTKELCVQWRGLQDFMRFELIPGSPATISYTNFNTEDIVTISNESHLPERLIVQLCDLHGNPTPEPNVKIQLGVDEGLKVSSALCTAKTDKNGRADFGKLAITVRPNLKPGRCAAHICPHNCRGFFSICAKAVCNRVAIVGALLKIHIPCDTVKPAEIKVEFEPFTECLPGCNLPEFRVQVFAEDGSVIHNVKLAQVSMKIRKVEDLKNPNSQVITYPPSEARDTTGYFYFRGRKMATSSGWHTVQFCYTSASHNVNSQLYKFLVLSGSPVKLVPSQDPGVLAVSNTQKLSSRSIIRNLRLELKDEFDNLAGVDLFGTLIVQITSGNTLGEIPRMVGNVTSIELPINKGQTVLQNICINENTPGIDGKEYILRCTPTFPKVKLAIQIPPYNIRFTFYNDAHKQAEMAQLSKQRDSLISVIKTYRTLFDTSQQLLRELADAVKKTSLEEANVRAELRRANFNPNSIQTVGHVKSALDKLIQSKSKLENTKRREFGYGRAPEEPGVLGKIGEIAWVEAEDVALVLSWHMQSDMDCVITHTMAKARDLHRRTNGQLQLLPLDSIYRKNLPDWSRPLPHLKVRSITPTGNPVYARNLLIFNKEPDNCKLVFGMLLGDTIILDTLDDATRYREQIVKFMFCPTLLTRTGERIRSNGKFGGQQNKAPNIERLRGMIFGEPPPKGLSDAKLQLELLHSLTEAIEKHRQTKVELAEQQKQENSEEMQEKQKEFRHAENQLKVLEDKIGTGIRDTSLNASREAGQGGASPGKRLSSSAGDEPLSKKRGVVNNESSRLNYSDTNMNGIEMVDGLSPLGRGGRKFVSPRGRGRKKTL